MRFPLPVRFTAPLIALGFGLAATWFDYRLNLDLDIARHLAELRGRADANGRRLALLAEQLLASGDRDILRAFVVATADLPGLAIGAVVNEDGGVIADATAALRGQSTEATRLADVVSLISPGEPRAQQRESAHLVVSAHPFRIGEGRTGWVLLEFDRTKAIAAAQEDAITQLRWMASAMALLSLILWAVLHFGFASQLAQLANSMRAFGENRTDIGVLPQGGDEVGQLSRAFAQMAATLRERDAEQLRLEGEVLEISEREQRRIGHDLHDGIGQRLTAASMAANAAVMALETDAPIHAACVAGIGHRLREAIAEARALSHGLAPVELKDEGLMQALRSLAETTSQSTGVRCVFDCPATVLVSDSAVATNLYRIAQEAVNNALKHAAPSEIRVGLERRDGLLLLEVDDDGEGFDEAASTGASMGLRVMRYRAKLIGGVLEIGSAPAGGARICCCVKDTE